MSLFHYLLYSECGVNVPISSIHG